MKIKSTLNRALRFCTGHQLRRTGSGPLSYKLERLDGHRGIGSGVLYRHILRTRFQRIVSRHRRSPFIKKSFEWLDTAQRMYENLDGEFETNGEKFVLEQLKDNNIKTIFDVGANIGQWSQMAHNIFSEATIHVFEIAPPTFRILLDNLANCPRIVLNNLGLSDQPGEVTVNFFPENTELTMLYNYPHQLESIPISCPVTSGDAYIEKNGIEYVDYLKVDVEGAEPLVLKGLERAFRQSRIGVVQFEYGQVNILTKFLLYDFYQFLEAHGFRVGKIYPNYVEFRPYRFEHEDFIGQNYLAIAQHRADLISRLS